MERHHRLATALACSLATSSWAIGCEVSDPPASQREIDQASRAAFEQARGVYEGIIVAEPDFASDGTFWVLRTHKGPTKPFDLLPLPPAGGCIGALGPSGVLSAGLLSVSGTPHHDRFNGLTTEERIASWKRQQFIDGYRISLIKIGLLGLAIIVLTIGAVVLKRRHSRSGKSAR